MSLEVPATMQAIYLTEPLTLEQREVAVPQPADDEVLVRVESVGVCGSDVHYYQHGRVGPFVVERPLVLGHEAAGTVVAVGAAVTANRIGSRVAIEPQRPCRRCHQCKAGRYNLCPHMRFLATPPVDGAFVDYITIPADFAHPVPDTVSTDAAALCEPLSVAIWANRKAATTAGSRVLITGAGPVGLLCAQIARALGAGEVVMSDVVESRRRQALTLGATAVLDPRDTELSEAVEPDVFIDASGAASAVRSGLHALAPAGTAVLVGLGQDEIALPVSTIQTKELVVTGVFRYANTWPTAITLIDRGLVNVDPLVTARFGLADSRRALEHGSESGAIKAVVDPALP